MKDQLIQQLNELQFLANHHDTLAKNYSRQAVLTEAQLQILQQKEANEQQASKEESVPAEIGDGVSGD